ncbi:MAG TPA: BTAD domain-containing putative transcriptional regulator [Caldilineaceae bacterium]|nr:BTAD domain-containing putative transcriptional regulator [Caldilineaceae bacterium]
MVPKLQIRAFGPPTVQIEEGDGVERNAKFRSAKTQALFFYLAVTRQPQTRQTLLGLFWPDVTEKRAQTSLRVALNNLHTLFPYHLAIDRHEVRFCHEQPYHLDLDDLSAAMVASGSRVSSPTTVCESAPCTLPPTHQDEKADRVCMAESAGCSALASRLERQYAWLAHEPGEFLAGLDLADAPAFQSWLQAERKRWHSALASDLAKLATALLQVGRPTAAEATWQRLLAFDPSYEAAHYELMLLLGRRGDFAGGCSQFAACRQALSAALGAEPQAQTQALHARLQEAQRQPAQTLPEQTGLYATPFVGRNAELEQMQSMLANPACRLVTLAGLGGSGKTRLALEVARQVVSSPHRRFLNGVCFVPLHGVCSSGQLIQAVASAVGAPVTSSSSPLDQLCRTLSNREMLLVLDNLEEAMEASDAEQSAACLTTLLTRCPLLRLLVTSRRPLELSAEWLLSVDGLVCPQVHDPAWRAAPAVQLFLNTAACVQPTFALDDKAAAPIGQICRQVDGLPLAIQLAAARLATLSLAQIAAALDAGIDILSTRHTALPSRQRSMRTILEQTWRTMAKTEQSLLVDLAMLRGGFSEASAAAATGATPWALTGLVDHALLKVERTAQAEPRFFLPHLAAQFALDQRHQQPATMATS